MSPYRQVLVLTRFCRQNIILLIIVDVALSCGTIALDLTVCVPFVVLPCWLVLTARSMRTSYLAEF